MPDTKAVLKALYSGLEYSIRNTRHVIDAAWAEHSMMTGHQRTDIVKDTRPCAVCINLAASAQQNNGLLAQIAKEGREL